MVEIGYIFLRKKDGKIFSVRNIDEEINIKNCILYTLKSNDNDEFIGTLKDIKKKFN